MGLKSHGSLIDLVSKTSPTPQKKHLTQWGIVQRLSDDCHPLLCVCVTLEVCLKMDGAHRVSWHEVEAYRWRQFAVSISASRRWRRRSPLDLSPFSQQGALHHTLPLVHFTSLDLGGGVPNRTLLSFNCCFFFYYFFLKVNCKKAVTKTVGIA